jgi:hypothetical protein
MLPVGSGKLVKLRLMDGSTLIVGAKWWRKLLFKLDLRKRHS